MTSSTIWNSGATRLCWAKLGGRGGIGAGRQKLKTDGGGERRLGSSEVLALVDVIRKLPACEAGAESAAQLVTPWITGSRSLPKVAEVLDVDVPRFGVGQHGADDGGHVSADALPVVGEDGGDAGP